MDFAEIEKFLDTPVKRYSSGMYVRLAFAVAAHLEPEILIIDEVLAVGDVVFQKKCLGKMQSAADSGRTVLFVSHNMQTVAGLTERAILLQSGRVASMGPSGRNHRAISWGAGTWRCGLQAGPERHAPRNHAHRSAHEWPGAAAAVWQTYDRGRRDSHARACSERSHFVPDHDQQSPTGRSRPEPR